MKRNYKVTNCFSIRVFCLLILLLFYHVSAQDHSTVEGAIAKAKLRMKGFKMPKGMKADLWADTSQIINPSAICFDSKGNLYVAEVNRWGAGVISITDRMHMVWEDIQLKSNEERMAMYLKHSSKTPMKWYTETSDKIKVLSDSNGDGKAMEKRNFKGTPFLWCFSP